MAPLIAGQMNIAQCDSLPGKLRTYGAAKKLAAIEEPHLAHVARVITQHDTLTDIRGKGGVDVTHALETHAVRMDLSRFGDCEEKQIELLKGLRHTRNKSPLLPALLGWNLGFPVGPRMVLAQELTEATIEFGQGQCGFAENTTATDVA